MKNSFIFLILLNIANINGADLKKELIELNTASYQNDKPEGFKIILITFLFQDTPCCFNWFKRPGKSVWHIRFPLENISFLKFKEKIREFLKKHKDYFKNNNLIVTASPKYFFYTKDTVYMQFPDNHSLNLSDYEEIEIKFLD